MDAVTPPMRPGRGWRDAKPGERVIQTYHTKETHELRDIPPELMARMGEIERAYAEHVAWKDSTEGRVGTLEDRMSASDQRQLDLAAALGELSRHVGYKPAVAGVPAVSGPTTAIAIHMEPGVPAPIDTSDEFGELRAVLYRMAAKLHDSIVLNVSSLTQEINGVRNEVAQQRAELDATAAAWLEVKRLHQELFK